MVGFIGLKAYLQATSDGYLARLIEQLGERLVEVMGGAGAVFVSRRGEFCVLCDGGVSAVRTNLALLPSLLDAIGRPFDVRSTLGIALLPDEATVPTYALALADRRLRAIFGETRT